MGIGSGNREGKSDAFFLFFFFPHQALFHLFTGIVTTLINTAFAPLTLILTWPREYSLEDQNLERERESETGGARVFFLFFFFLSSPPHEAAGYLYCTSP